LRKEFLRAVALTHKRPEAGAVGVFAITNAIAGALAPAAPPVLE